MKLNDKQTIKQAQGKSWKIEALKQDVIIWQQRYNKYSFIGKIMGIIP